LNNEAGIKIEASSTPDFIHHNNFVDNALNAYDECSNQWDTGSEGNYWDDYTGIDEDDDGIGDVPYEILGSDSKDNRPFMESILSIPENIIPEKPDMPSGPGNGRIGRWYTYMSSAKDPDGVQIFYWWDWGDGNSSGWLGPYVSGDMVNASYRWNSTGEYIIRVKAIDLYGDESSWSDPLSVSMPKNKPYINTPFLQFLENFFEKYPNAFPILRHLMGL